MSLARWKAFPDDEFDDEEDDEDELDEDEEGEDEGEDEEEEGTWYVRGCNGESLDFSRVKSL